MSCNCILGIVDIVSDDVFVVYKDDIESGRYGVNIYDDIDFFNYCPLCGKEVRKDEDM